MAGEFIGGGLAIGALLLIVYTVLRRHPILGLLLAGAFALPILFPGDMVVNQFQLVAAVLLTLIIIGVSVRSAFRRRG